MSRAHITIPDVIGEDENLFTTARFDDDDLPRIVITGQDTVRLTDEAWKAVEAANQTSPYLFRHGGLPVRIEEEIESGQTILVTSQLNDRKARYELRRVANWFREKRGQEYPADPPAALVQDFLASHDVPLPELGRIVRVPVFSKSGELEMHVGYSRNSQNYYFPQPGLQLLPVSANPTREEIKRARSLIVDELLADFP